MHAIKFFLDKTHYEEEDILEYKVIHQGYTNNNWLIKTNDGTFILRTPIKRHDFVNEFNAYQNYQKIKFYEFDQKNGIYIKPFLVAEHPQLGNKKHLELIIDEIQQVHCKKVKHKIKQQDWFEWIEYNVLDSKVLSYFYKINNKIKNDPKVFTHHDLNAANILVNNNDVFLIDWEWARLDSPYFDFATLALNEHVDEKLLIKYANLDEKRLDYYKFMILVFSHMWCIYMNTKQTLQLKDQIFLEIKKMMPKIM